MDGAVVKAVVLKRTAKRAAVKVPVVLYGVVSWDAMSEPIVAAILARKAARASEIEALRIAVMDLNELNPDWN